MNNVQLLLAVGLPTLAVLVGILVNGMQFSHAFGALSARMTSLENHVENRLQSMEAKIEMLTGKVIDLDNRLTRLEERYLRRS